MLKRRVDVNYARLRNIASILLCEVVRRNVEFSALDYSSSFEFKVK